MLINLADLTDYSRLMKIAPQVLLRHLAKGFSEIGRTDMQRLKTNLPGQLNIRARGLLNSFKSKATDPAKATDASKLFADEYTGWKAATIFEKGGTVLGKGKRLTVLFPDARGAGGRRKISQKQLRSMIASGKVRFIHTPRGTLIVQAQGASKKTGYGKRDTILGILKTSVRQRKRLDFFGNAEKAGSLHQDILETAIENAMVELMTKE